MIYEATELGDPIRQGDIFVGLPKIDLSLKQMLIVDQGQRLEARWQDIAGRQTEPEMVLPAPGCGRGSSRQDGRGLPRHHSRASTGPRGFTPPQARTVEPDS